MVTYIEIAIEIFMDTTLDIEIPWKNLMKTARYPWIISWKLGDDHEYMHEDNLETWRYRDNHEEMDK
jgi:hypothetical protein